MKKSFWSKKFFWSKTIFSQKIFLVKNFFGQKIYFDQCITATSASPPGVITARSHHRLQCVTTCVILSPAGHNHHQCITTFSASPPAVHQPPTVHHHRQCITIANAWKNGKKIQKPVGGVSASQDWSQKNPLAKRIFFCKKHFLRKHPQVAKKWVFSLKNRNFCYFSQVLLKKLKQNSRN